MNFLLVFLSSLLFISTSFAQTLTYNNGDQIVLPSYDYSYVDERLKEGTLCRLKAFKEFRENAEEWWQADCDVNPGFSYCETVSVDIPVNNGYSATLAQKQEWDVPEIAGVAKKGDLVWVNVELYAYDVPPLAFIAEAFGVLDNYDIYVKDQKGCWSYSSAQVSPISSTGLPQFGPQMGQDVVYVIKDYLTSVNTVTSGTIWGTTARRDFSYSDRAATSWEQSTVIDHAYYLDNGSVWKYSELYWVPMDFIKYDLIGAHAMRQENGKLQLFSIERILGKTDEYYNNPETAPVDTDNIYEMVFFDGMSSTWRTWESYSYAMAPNTSTEIQAHAGDSIYGNKVIPMGAQGPMIVALSDDTYRDDYSRLLGYNSAGTVAATADEHFYLLFSCDNINPANFKKDSAYQMCPVTPAATGEIYAYLLQ